MNNHDTQFAIWGIIACVAVVAGAVMYMATEKHETPVLAQPERTCWDQTRWNKPLTMTERLRIAAFEVGYLLLNSHAYWWLADRTPIDRVLTAFTTEQTRAQHRWLAEQISLFGIDDEWMTPLDVARANLVYSLPWV